LLFSPLSQSAFCFVQKHKISLSLPNPDSDVMTYQIDFPYYVTYSVPVDDYTVWNDTEQFRGDPFRIYEKSTFLDYVKKEYKLQQVLPSNVFGGKQVTHYALACHEHFININSFEEPTITVVTSW
jgi:hypothetical protein